MALKNSKTGSLPVSEIYNFMTEHFPYFKVSSAFTGGDGGKKNLSLIVCKLPWYQRDNGGDSR